MDRIHFSASNELSYRKIALRLAKGDAHAKSIVFEKHEEGDWIEPFIHLDIDEAQELSNALWNAGIRPEQSKQSQGAFEAQADHLNDMRIIAMDRLKIDVGGK